jgi:hypothetical protein
MVQPVLREKLQGNESDMALLSCQQRLEQPSAFFSGPETRPERRRLCGHPGFSVS